MTILHNYELLQSVGIYSKPRLSRIQVDWGILSELRENPT